MPARSSPSQWSAPAASGSRPSTVRYSAVTNARFGSGGSETPAAPAGWTMTPFSVRSSSPRRPSARWRTTRPGRNSAPVVPSNRNSYQCGFGLSGVGPGGAVAVGGVRRHPGGGEQWDGGRPAGGEPLDREADEAEREGHAGRRVRGRGVRRGGDVGQAVLRRGAQRDVPPRRDQRR